MPRICGPPLRRAGCALRTLITGCFAPSPRQDDWELALRTSTTVYVGNLSFYTTEDQIHEVFSKAGKVKQIIMGLDRQKKTPCGFCFVEFFTYDDAQDACKYINGALVDERAVRVDMDWGFVEGRQFGRGRSGGQVRDEFRTDYDPGRGGYGHIMSDEMRYMQQQQQLGMADGASPYEGYGKRPRSNAVTPGSRGPDATATRNPRFRDADSDDERDRDHEDRAGPSDRGAKRQRGGDADMADAPAAGGAEAAGASEPKAGQQDEGIDDSAQQGRQEEGQPAADTGDGAS